ncbi:hypothetical protein TeGR_g8308, partial [Tetraparma gracilis]
YDDDYDSDDDSDEDSFYAAGEGFALDEDPPDSLLPRCPVVTVMGHVDHGKTSLLDALRSAAVQSTEAGGITQHIAAYQLGPPDARVTMIDTPGHAAFADMRSRGANITDVVVLVVAADDGVMPQTLDSIDCARAAGAPVVVAVNKCDLDSADPGRVKADLAGKGLLVEELGGDVLCADISAKTGAGVDELLAKIRLQADLMDLRANPDRYAAGAVVEARVEKGLGTVATVLVQKGTLKVGDAFVAGAASGRVRALLDTAGGKVAEARPSTPVTVVGFGGGAPLAGDLFVVAKDQDTARQLSDSRTRLAREEMAASYQQGLLLNVADLIENGLEGRKARKEMTVIVKADVQGSAEALRRALGELTLSDGESEVAVNVLVAEAGEVTKMDIQIAAVRPGTTVIAFGVAATNEAMEEARVTGRPIKCSETVFNIGGTGNIAGSKCLDGRLKKGSNVRVMRKDKILVNSVIKTLRNLKTEVGAIEEGTECGIGLVDFEDMQTGDRIECYILDTK